MPEWHGAIERESMLWENVGKHEQDKGFMAQITCGVFSAYILDNLSDGTNLGHIKYRKQEVTRNALKLVSIQWIAKLYFVTRL